MTRCLLSQSLLRGRDVLAGLPTGPADAALPATELVDSQQCRSRRRGRNNLMVRNDLMGDNHLMVSSDLISNDLMANHLMVSNDLMASNHLMVSNDLSEVPMT